MLLRISIKTFSLLALILFVFTANATNYYLSNSGNDANPGTDPSAPWQTLSKLNSFKNLRPGDNVLFKRGDRRRSVPAGLLRPLAFQSSASLRGSIQYFVCGCINNQLPAFYENEENQRNLQDALHKWNTCSYLDQGIDKAVICSSSRCSFYRGTAIFA